MYDPGPMLTRSLVALCLLLGTAGCHSRGGADDRPGGEDAAAPQDGGDDQGGDTDLRGSDDLGLGTDLRAGDDLRAGTDLRPGTDLRGPDDLRPADGGPDGGTLITADIDIYVDNFCKMDVVPKNVSVPRGQTMKLTYHNRSSDYEVDVWLSYGGGYLDLATGGIWADRFEHCAFPRPYKAYADISTACSSYRLYIDCP